jgi:hypothetical protein
VCTRLAITLKETRLTGGALFKVRQIVLDDEVLVLRKERDAAIRNGKRQGIIKFVKKKNTRNALSDTGPSSPPPNKNRSIQYRN